MKLLCTAIIFLVVLCFFSTTDALKDEIITNPAVPPLVCYGSVCYDNSLFIDIDKMAESGDNTAFLYHEKFTKKDWVYFRNSKTGSSSHVFLPNNTDGATAIVIRNSNELWVFGGAGPVTVTQYTLTGGPLPTTATFVSNWVFGNAGTSRGMQMIGLESGGLIAMWYDYVVNADNHLDVGFAYRSPSGEWTTKFPVRIEPTGGNIPSSVCDMAQHPVDKSIWAFNHRDSYDTIAAVHLTETGSTINVDWVNPSFRSDIYGEFPSLRAISDRVNNKILLSYENNKFGSISIPGSPPGLNTQSCFINLASISTDGTTSIMNFNIYVQAFTDIGLISLPGGLWVTYYPLTRVGFYDLYAIRYDGASWSNPLYLGRTKAGYYGSLIGKSASRLEYAVYLNDSKIHFFTDLNGVPNNPPNPPTPQINTSTESNSDEQDLYCSSTVSDFEGDVLDVIVNWYRNGTLMKTYNYYGFPSLSLVVSSLKEGNTSVGDSWKCNMRLYDGKSYSQTRESFALSILQGRNYNKPNTPVIVLNSSWGTNTVQENLTCYSIITDLDGDSMRVNLTWYKNGKFSGGSWSSTYYTNGTLIKNTLPSWISKSPGDIFYCTMRLTDSYNTSDIGYSNNLVMAGGAPPQNCSDGTLYGGCSVTKPKYCKDGTLVDNCSRCGCPSGQNCNTTSLACYTPISPPQTCSDGTVYSQCSLTIPKYCNNGALVDNCSRCDCLSGQSCNTTSLACYTPVIPPTNSQPVKPTPSLRSSSNFNTTGEDLTCSATITDPDGDKLNVTVNWYNKGSIARVDFYKNQTSGTQFNSILGAGNLTAGDQWMCRMMLNDSRAASDWGQSNTVNIVSGAPSNACSDGTAYSQCSSNLPLYCDDGTLIASCENCGCPSGQTCATDTESCFTPTPPPSQSPGGGAPGGGAPSGGTPSGGTTAPPSSCKNSLTITVAENIIIPQRITKDVNMVVTNTGTCPLSSLAAALVLPAGWRASSYNLADGLAVNGSQGITITVFPPDIDAGTYSAVLKLDAPELSEEKQVIVSLIENTPYEVVMREVPIEERVFTFIIFIIIVEFGIGSVIIMLWTEPRDKLPPFMPTLRLPPQGL